MTTLTQRIADTERQIAAMTAQDVYTESQSREPGAADVMDRLLCRAATGYVELPETDTIARTLLTLALDRAYEVMLLTMLDDRRHRVADRGGQRQHHRPDQLHNHETTRTQARGVAAALCNAVEHCSWSRAASQPRHNQPIPRNFQ